MSDVVTKKDVDELRQSLSDCDSDLTIVVHNLARTVREVNTSDWNVRQIFSRGQHTGESSKSPLVHVNSLSSSSDEDEWDKDYEGVYQSLRSTQKRLQYMETGTVWSLFGIPRDNYPQDYDRPFHGRQHEPFDHTEH